MKGDLQRLNTLKETLSEFGNKFIITMGNIKQKKKLLTPRKKFIKENEFNHRTLYGSSINNSYICIIIYALNIDFKKIWCYNCIERWKRMKSVFE